MIGQIRGTLIKKTAPELCVEVNGLGYEIDAPMSTFDRLPAVGESVLLYTHLVVREDAHLLYGFFTQEERTLFRTLIKVNGIGPKLGLTILSSMDPHGFAECVRLQDAESLIHIKGLGKKTAERLLIEMRDKLTAWQPATSPAVRGQRGLLQDAIAALITLGYKPSEASRLITKIDDGTMSVEEMIRRALLERIV